MAGKIGLSAVLSTIIVFTIILGAVITVSLYSNMVLFSQQGEGEFKAAESTMVAFAMNVEDAAWNVGATRSIDFNPKFGYLQVVEDAYEYVITINGNNFLRVETDIPMFRMPIRRYTRGNHYHSTLYPLMNKSFITLGAADPTVRVISVEELDYTDTLDVALLPRVKILRSQYVTPEGVKESTRVMIISFYYDRSFLRASSRYLIANCTITNTSIISGDNMQIVISVHPLNLPTEYLDFDPMSYSFRTDILVVHVAYVKIVVW